MEDSGRTKRPAYRIIHWAWRSLDLLFPPTCGGCDKPGDRLCINCKSTVKRLPVKVCAVCGEPVFKQGLCARCQNESPSYKQLRSYAVYEGPIRNALLKLKFRRNISLGEALSTFLIGYFPELKWTVDLIVPVPLSKQRFQERGYNQVETIARPFSLAVGIAYSSRLLVREKDNPSQVGLSGDLRRQNVKDAFRANGSLARGKRILVIDDITTTGATMEACARALMIADAQEVYCLTLAKALPGKSWQNS